MEIEERQADGVVRLYVRGSFVCSAKVQSSDQLKNFFLKNAGINLKWRLDVEEAEQRFFENVSALSTVRETASKGWFYNVCELRAYRCPARFNNLRTRIDRKVAMVKVGKDQLLLMTNNKLTDRLGLKPMSLSSDGPSLYCIHMSRESSQAKDGLVDIHIQDKKTSSPYLHTKSDRYTRGFCTWPPDSSLLTKDTVSKVFQKQYDMYRNLKSETSCARIDHQYIEKKLVKGDNLDKEKVEDEERMHVEEGNHEEENFGKTQDVEKKHINGDNAEKENHWKGGKTERCDGEEEILPDRKRHKSENHKKRLEPEDKHSSEIRKRHRTTSDASSFTSVELDTKNSASLICDENGHASDKEHASSRKHVHGSDRKEKHCKESQKHKSDRNDINSKESRKDVSDRKDKHSKESQKEKKSSSQKSKVSDGVIDLTKDENVNPNSAVGKKSSDMSGRSDNESQKIREKDRTLKHSGKESLLSKLEFSLKSMKKKEKDKTEEKKSKHSDKHRSSSKSSKSDKPSAGLGKQRNVEQVFSSMFSGLTKELGRIPKKNKATSETPVASIDDFSKAPKETKTSESKRISEKVEKCSKSKSHKSDRKEKESKHKDSKHKHDRDKDKERTKKSKHHKEKTKRKSDDSEPVIASEREDDVDVFDSVGSGFDIQEMVRDALSGREKLKTKLSGVTDFQPKMNEEKEVVIPGFGDLEELDVFQSRSKTEVKHIKRSVRVTDSDLKILLPADIVRKGQVGVKLDLQTLVNLALFGDEVTSPMTAVCLHLYNCVLTLHDFSPSMWTKSVSKEMVEAKKKHLYTVRMFNPEFVQKVGNTGEKLYMENDENKQEKTKRSGFDDVTNKLMSIVQKEKSKDWTFPEKGKLSGKCSADRVLVIPMPTMANLSSSDDDDEVSDLNIRLDNEKDKRIVTGGKTDPVNELNKSKDAKEVKTGKEVIGQVKDVRSETDNDKPGVAATSMAAPTSRPNTPSDNQIRKRRSSSTEKECLREKSRDSKKGESQDRKRSRSKERNSRDNSKDRRRSKSRHRSGRSRSRDRNRRSTSRDGRTETPTECDKDDIGKRLEKIAASAMSTDPDKMTNRTEKRRERQYHPYKKDSRPSKRHIPHWSFDLAYSDMNELLQNLTENTFKKTNSRPANVGSHNKVGRRSYGNRGRFTSFRFRRSAVPRTPPREVYSSSEDEEYMVRPDDIPDLRERAKQADVLENFMGAGKDEKEFSKEMLIYEKENKEDKRIMCNKGNGSSQDLIIPGGPKTSTFSAQELEDSTDASGELAFLGSGRHVDNLERQTSQSSVIERQDSYTNNLIRSKIEEMKSSNKETKHSEKDGSAKEGTKVNTQKPDEKKSESNKTGMLVKEKDMMSSKSEKIGKEREKVFVSLEMSSSSPVTVGTENKRGNRERTEEDRDPAKENVQKKILSSESDVCLDWTDEEVALDSKEAVVFDDSSDGMSDYGHSRSYIVLDMIEGSDTEISTKPKAHNVNERKEMIKGRDSLISKVEIKEMNSSISLSDVEKSVQKSIESMVDSVCLNISESTYTVVDECTITPENSISDTSDLETTLAEFFETPKSESTALKPVGEMYKIKECRVVLTRVHSESYNLTKDSDTEGQSNEEERTSLEENNVEKVNQYDEEGTSVERKSNEELIEEKDDQYNKEETSVERKSNEELIEEKDDQCDEERTRVERESNDELTGEKVDQFVEERTILERKSKEKMTEEIPAVNEEDKNEDNEMLCNKSQSRETYEPEKKTDVEPFSKKIEPVTVDSLPIQKLVKGSEETVSTENIVASRFIQDVIGDCIARVDFVSDECSLMDGKECSVDEYSLMDGKECSNILEQTENIDEAGDRMVSEGTGVHIPERRQESLTKAEGNYLHSLQPEASYISPLIGISSDNSKEFSPSVYSEDSQTCTEIDPAFFGRDRLVFIDDIVITGVSELNIASVGKEMNALEYQKKDKFVMQYEIYRNSSVDGNDSDSEDVPDLDEFVHTYPKEDSQFHPSVKVEHLGGIGTNTAYCMESYSTIDDVKMKTLTICEEECFPNSTSAEVYVKENVQPERNIFDIMGNDLHVESKEKHEVKQVHEQVSTEGSFNFRTASDSDLTDLVDDSENVLIEIHTIGIDDPECESQESSDSSKQDKLTHNFSQVKQGYEIQIPNLFNTTAINSSSRDHNVEVEDCIRAENVYNIVKTENDFELVQKGNMNEINPSGSKREREFDFKKGNLSDNQIYDYTENVKSEPNVFLKDIPEGYTEILGELYETDSQVNELLEPTLCTSLITTELTTDTEIAKTMQNDGFKDTETNSIESEVIVETGDTPSSLFKEMVPNNYVTCSQSSIPKENSCESSSTVIYDLKDPQQTGESCKVNFGGIVNEDDESTSSTWAYPLSEPEIESSQRSSTYLSQIDDDAVFHIKDTIDEETDEKTLATEDVADAVQGNNNIVEELHSAEVTADLNVEVAEPEACQLGQDISQNLENANQPPGSYNPGVVTPIPYFPRPWLPVNRHPYDMWPTYPMWQPFLGPSSPLTSPHAGPSTQFMPSGIGHRSPLSPYIWNPIPVYAPSSGYSGSAGYSPYFMNYVINGNRPPVLPHQSPPTPSAVGMAPWMISSDNMTPYLPDQNPDTYFVTEHIIKKKIDDKESPKKKKKKVCSESLPILDIPVHEIPLPKSSPAPKRNNPRKLQDLCEKIIDDSRQMFNSQKHIHNIETLTVSNLTLSTVEEHSESENSELGQSLNEQSKDSDVSHENIQESSSTRYHICSGDDALSQHGTDFQASQSGSKNNKTTVETDGLVGKRSGEDTQDFKGTIHKYKLPWITSLENTVKNESDQTCLTGKALNSASHMSGVKQSIDHDLLEVEDVNIVGHKHTMLNSSVSHKADEQIPEFEPDKEISCYGKQCEVESSNIPFSSDHLLSTLKCTITDENLSRTPADKEISDFGPYEDISCSNNKTCVENENMPNLPMEANPLKTTKTNLNLSKTENVSFPNDSVEVKFGIVLSKKCIPELVQNEVLSEGLKENEHVEKGKDKNSLETSNVYSGFGTILDVLKESEERLQTTEKHKSEGIKLTEVKQCTLYPADEHNCELREGKDVLSKDSLSKLTETVRTSGKVETEVENEMIDCELALFYKDICEVETCANLYEDPVDFGETSTVKAETNAECDKLAEENETRVDLERSRNTCSEVTVKHLHVDTVCVSSSQKDSKINIESVRKRTLPKIQQVDSDHPEAGVGKMNDGKELDINKFDSSCNNNSGVIENENVPDQSRKANVLYHVGHLLNTLKNTNTNENLSETESINFPDVSLKTDTGAVSSLTSFLKIRQNEVMSDGLEKNEHVDKGKVRSKLKTSNVCYGIGATLDMLKDSDRKPLNTEKQNCSGSKHTEITKHTCSLAEERCCKLAEGDEVLCKNSGSENREKIITPGKLEPKVGNGVMESELALFYKDICEFASDENVLHVGKAATYSAKQNADCNELAKESETKMDIKTSRNICSDMTVKHLHVDTDCMSSSHKDTKGDVETVRKLQLPKIHIEEVNDGKELNIDELEIEDGNKGSEFETDTHEIKASVTRTECESDSTDGSLLKSDLHAKGSAISERMAVLAKDTDVCSKKDTSVSHVKSIPSSIQKKMVESKDSSEEDSAVDCKEDQIEVELKATSGLIQGIEERDLESTSSAYDKLMPVDNLDVSLTTTGGCKYSKDLADRTDKNSIHSINSAEQCFVTDKVEAFAGEIDQVSHSFLDDSCMGAKNQSESWHADSYSEEKTSDNEKVFPTLDCPISEIPLPDTRQCETSSGEQTVSKSVDSVSKSNDANISVAADFVNSDSHISVYAESGSRVQNALVDLQTSYKNDDSEILLAQDDSALNNNGRKVTADTEMITSDVQLKSNNFEFSDGNHCDSNHSGVSCEISSSGKNIKQYSPSESSEIMLCVENIMKCKWTEVKDEIDHETEEVYVEHELDSNLLKSKVLLSNTPGSPSNNSEKRSREQHDVRQRLENFKCKLAETKNFEDVEHAKERTDEQMTNNKTIEEIFDSQSAEIAQRAEKSMNWKLTERDVDIKTEQVGEKRTETEVIQKTNGTELYLKARGVVRTADRLNEEPVEVDIFLTDKKEQNDSSNKHLGCNTAQTSNEQKDITQYLRKRGVVSHRVKPSTKCVIQSLFGIKSKQKSAAKNGKDKMHQQRNKLRLKAMFQANQLNYSKQAQEDKDKEAKLTYTKDWINKSVQQMPVIQNDNEKNKLNLDISDKAELQGDRSGSVSSTRSRRTYSNSSCSRSSSRSSSLESEYNQQTYKFKSRTYRKYQGSSDSSASTVSEHENGKPYLPGNGNTGKMTGSLLLSKNSSVGKVGSKRFCRRYRSISSSSKSDFSAEQGECSDEENKTKKLKTRRKKSSSSSQDRHKRCKSGNYKSSSGSSREWIRRDKSKSERKRLYSSSSSDRYKRETPIRGYRSRSRQSRGKYSTGKTRYRRNKSYSSSRERSLRSSSRETYRKEKRRYNRNRSTSSSSRRKHGLDGHYRKRESRWSEYNRQRNRFRNRNIFPSSQSYYSETSSDSQRWSDSSSCSRREYGRRDAFNRESVCIDRENSSYKEKESIKKKLMMVQEQEQSRTTKRNHKPVLGSSSSDMNGSTSKGQQSPKGGNVTEALKALAQYTEVQYSDSLELPDESKDIHEEQFSADLGNPQNVKTVLLKPAVLKKLTPAGLGKFLQILDQFSTDRCEWCLALFAADVMALEDSKQEAVRTIETRYRNFTIMSDVNSVDSYLVMELRNPSVLEIFVIIEPPDEDENIRSLIRYCCMETFLEEHISSM